MTDQLKSYTDSLEVAQKLAKELKIVPSFSLFYSCIRSIRSARANGKDPSEIASKRGAELVGMSPTLKAVFYSAAQVYHKESLERCAELNVKNLVKMFTPDEITSIIALVYLAKKIHKKCSSEDEKAEWDRMQPKMVSYMSVAATVGDTIEYIGVGNGIFIGGIRFLASFMFSLFKIEEFKKYRRQTASQNKLWDLELELTTFGCNHLQVASFLTQFMGFGLGTVQGLALAFEDELKSAEAANDPSLANQLLCWRAAIRWSEMLYSQGKLPESATSETDEMYMPPEQQAKLLEKVASIKATKASDPWIFRSFEQLPPEIQAKLITHDSKGSEHKESPEAELQ